MRGRSQCRAAPPLPQTSLFLLLLLSPGLRGTPDCSFTHSPISSTFTGTIRKLVRARCQPLPRSFLRLTFCLIVPCLGPPLSGSLSPSLSLGLSSSVSSCLHQGLTP